MRGRRSAPRLPELSLEIGEKRARVQRFPVFRIVIAAVVATTILISLHSPHSPPPPPREEPEKAVCTVPGEFERTYYTVPPNAKFGAALARRGWRRAGVPQNAHVIWYQKKQHIPWGHLSCWQRPNHLRDERTIGHKGLLLEALRETPAARYLPESYALWVSEDRKRFETDLAVSEDEGTTPSWVIKEPNVDGGKGVTVLTAIDAKAKLLSNGTIRSKFRSMLAQRYVSNLMLLDGHKFDLRVYWVVASMQPPIVLYHDGTLRVSLSRFDDANHTRGQHLTNAAQQEGGHDKDKSSEASRQSMPVLWNLLDELRPSRPDWPANPRAHVECAIRYAIAHIWQAFAPLFSKKLGEAHRESDAFVLFGADFMLDTDLRLYMSEIQSGPGLPTNTQAVRHIMWDMLPSLVDLVTHLHARNASADELSPRWPLPPSTFDLLINDTTVVASPWCSA